MTLSTLCLGLSPLFFTGQVKEGTEECGVVPTFDAPMFAAAKPTQLQAAAPEQPTFTLKYGATGVNCCVGPPVWFLTAVGWGTDCVKRKVRYSHEILARKVRFLSY